ncbi:hypothetical protein TW84_04510 [Vibrio neptunius]|uniref:hypothetical protein n=1 Tax=Vibrio neptunius TaxID=170651 RepID=UPI0005F9DDD7|nr:hypothetical protein [Vibrio neptunius]KJY93140.1 hypothetical protein TW84_04510 [Vibrio neptunius]
MYTQVEKIKENRSRSVANSVGQKKSNGKQGFGFVDNRIETVAQKKLQSIANNYSTTQPIQRVQVTISGQQKELSTLTVSEMERFLRMKNLSNTALTEEEKVDVATWVEQNKVQKGYKVIESQFTKLYPEVIPEAVKDFGQVEAVTLNANDIGNAIGGEKQQIGATSYYISASPSTLNIYYGEEELGKIRYSIQDNRVGVETINIRNHLQGKNLSRLIMVAFCKYGLANNATTYKLNTADTSGGWWAQWGSQNLTQILSRGDMQNIYLPSTIS